MRTLIYASVTLTPPHSQPSLQSTLPGIRKILASDVPAERASAELAELLGFNQLDLVEQAIAQRGECVQKVCISKCSRKRNLVNDVSVRSTLY